MIEIFVSKFEYLNNKPISTLQQEVRARLRTECEQGALS